MCRRRRPRRPQCLSRAGRYSALPPLFYQLLLVCVCVLRMIWFIPHCLERKSEDCSVSSNEAVCVTVCFSCRRDDGDGDDEYEFSHLIFFRVFFPCSLLFVILFSFGEMMNLSNNLFVGEDSAKYPSSNHHTIITTLGSNRYH